MCDTSFASFQQSVTGLDVPSVQFLHNLQYIYGSTERTMSVKLFQATHFSKKKPGSQGCIEASVAGRNIRWPSLMGPNGVDGGVI
jgi:hypothetical protein